MNFLLNCVHPSCAHLLRIQTYVVSKFNAQSVTQCTNHAEKKKLLLTTCSIKFWTSFYKVCTDHV